MRVTTNSIITAGPSSSMPTLKFTPPLDHQVMASRTGATDSSVPLSTWWNHWMFVARASTNETPSAVMPISAPLRGRRFPKARMRKNEAAGMSGMIQAWSSTAIP